MIGIAKLKDDDKSRPAAWSRRFLAALALCALAAGCNVAFNWPWCCDQEHLGDEPPIELAGADETAGGNATTASDDVETNTFFQFPKAEVALLNFSIYAAMYPLAEMPSELVFLGELLDVAQHNLATLSGEETYYKRQSPFKMRLSDKYKLFSWSDMPHDLLAGMGTAGENAVSLPAPELKKVGFVGKLFERLTKNEADFEIPNWPLEAQPDPNRVTHIDADLRACTDAIKDQRACGACYAFSWLSLVEWHHCRQQNSGQVADFSEQHVVDCGHVARLSGCVEGKLSDVKDFTQVFGIHLERDYPYTSKRGPCKTQQGSLSVRVNDFRRIKIDREQFERTLEEQPILLEVHLPADITSYSSGIHPGANCDAKLGHGMLLVGHGRQEGRPYWLLRNSMGRRWGENGYLRLARDLPQMDSCFKSAFVAKFRFKSLDEEKYVDFYDSLAFEPARDAGPAAARKRAGPAAGSMSQLLAGAR